MLVESSALHAQSVPAAMEGGQAKVAVCSSTSEQRAAVGLVWMGVCALVLVLVLVLSLRLQRGCGSTSSSGERHQHGRPGAHTWKSTVQSILAGP